MSHHQGIVCEACTKGNLKGRRFRCLKCFDYDLCASCYDTGNTSPRHSATHPMQCILTQSDLELYYGSEPGDQLQALTCPFCGCMGHTEAKLTEHVYYEHPESVTSLLVACPICVINPERNPNSFTENFLEHLRTEHNRVPSDLISSSDESTTERHSLRRTPQSSRDRGRERVRRTNFSGDFPRFYEIRGTQSNSFSRLLPQLSSDYLSEAQQYRTRLQNDVSRRHRRSIFNIGRETVTTGTSSNLLGNQVVNSSSIRNQSTRSNKSSNNSSNNSRSSPQFLIQYISAAPTESEQQKLDVDQADRSFFLQDLFLSMLTPNENIPATTIAGKDQLSLVTEAQPQVSQTLTKSLVPNSKQQQTNKLPSPSMASPSQQSSHEGDLHRNVSPPVMQSKIPQLVANTRKQPKVTDPSSSN